MQMLLHNEQMHQHQHQQKRHVLNLRLKQEWRRLQK
jgi:hypothetical protein